MKTTSCTALTGYSFDLAPRCGAHTKRNHGNPCQAPAVKGKQRCRMHGGSQGTGARKGNINALKHGSHTAEMKGFRRAVKQVIHDAIVAQQ